MRKSTNLKSVENRVRRLAARNNCGIQKSRTRYLHINDHGKYMLYDAYRNVVILGADFDATLDEIEIYLTS